MRKDITLPLLAAAAGAAGFLLRRWQLASAYQSQEGLFIHGAPATLALMALVLVTAAGVALLVREKREGLDDFLPAFTCPEAWQITLLASAGLLMMAAGIWGLWKSMNGIQLWQDGVKAHQPSVLAAWLVAAALCLPAGIGVLLMGRMAYRNELDDTACRLASFPALAGLMLLFSFHLQNGTDPVLMKYGFQLGAICLLTLAHYQVAAFLFGRPRPRLTLFLALTGFAAALTALADRPDAFTAVALLAFALSALAFARALLRNAFGPAWPERMPPEEDTNHA